MGYTRGMSRDPFKPTTDQSTEMGWGPGMFPNPSIDYSDGGIKSGFPLGDPDRRMQYLALMAARRTDLNRADVPDIPAFQGIHAPHPDFFTEGNTERFGANPALVRARSKPPPKKHTYVPRAHMEREY